MKGKIIISLILTLSGCEQSKPEINDLLAGSEWECRYTNEIVDVKVNTNYSEDGRFLSNSIVKTKLNNGEEAAEVKVSLSGAWYASGNELTLKTMTTDVFPINDAGQQTLGVINDSLVEMKKNEVTKIKIVDKDKYFDVTDGNKSTCLRKTSS